MKKLLPFLLLISMLACHKDDELTIDPDPILGPVQEATGTLSDNLAVDGCSLLLTIKIDSTTYANYGIDDQSKSLAQQAIPNNRGDAVVDVAVRFQPTGRKKDVLCGWVGAKPYNEIRILSIKLIQYVTFPELTEYLQAHFGPDAFGIETANYQPYLTLSADKLFELCQFLRDDERLYFDLLACITAIDSGPEKDTMDVVYNLTSIPYEHNLMLRVTVPRHTGTTAPPTLPSLTALWRTADWHEREAYDLLGIYFDNHPDLRRILLPTDWTGHPLRLDYHESEQYHGIKTK